MKKLFKNSHWSTEDKLLAAAGVAAAVGIFAIVKQKKDAAAAATVVAGLRGMRGLGALGLGAYFIDPVYKPISGLGFIRVR